MPCIVSLELKDKTETFENDIDTILSKEFSSNGLLLSNGEMQRLAISRIYFRNSSIIFLDEASSALSENGSESYYKLLQNNDLKTIIYITHRKEELEFADVIIQLQNGKINRIISRSNKRKRV